MTSTPSRRRNLAQSRYQLPVWAHLWEDHIEGIYHLKVTHESNNTFLQGTTMMETSDPNEIREIALQWKRQLVQQERIALEVAKKLSA